MKYFELFRVAELLPHVASINLLWEERIISFTGNAVNQRQKDTSNKLIGGISNVAASSFVVYNNVTRDRQERKHHELLMKIYCLNRSIRRISQESY